jgi:D-3-phosphoglycerate dehydrogenase / 2-oxoglutarate reductase
MKRKVLFLDSVHPNLFDRLKNAGYNCVHAEDKGLDFIYEESSIVFGLVVRARFYMDKEFLSRFKNLRFIARSGSGLENIDYDYCRQNNIALFNSPEGNRNAVAEHALALLMGCMNNIYIANDEIKKGFWNRESNRGEELKGKTVGIIGFGHNGRAFAEKLVAFGVTILAHDKYISIPNENGIINSSLEMIFNQADVVSLHLPLTDETHYYADDVFFSQFSKPIYFINISRGKIVETSALVRAIQSRKIKASGLDVLEFEAQSFESLFNKEIPAPLLFLMNAPNVILTPHIAGWTQESHILLSDVLADKILSFSFL